MRRWHRSGSAREEICATIADAQRRSWVVFLPAVEIGKTEFLEFNRECMYAVSAAGGDVAL